MYREVLQATIKPQGGFPFPVSESVLPSFLLGDRGI